MDIDAMQPPSIYQESAVVLQHPAPGSSSVKAVGSSQAASTSLSYPPLRRRLHLDGAPESTALSPPSHTRFSSTVTQRLQLMLAATPLLATVGPRAAPDHVRFVVVSDTHNQHRSIVLPPGEVLLHCGDLVGNYGSEKLLPQLMDVAAWLHSLTQYKRIFLIPGNHDTLLDLEQYPRFAPAAAAFTAALPPHATLLLPAGGAMYRGLRLWGSPIVPCRQEALGVRYISSGFERTEAYRRAMWSHLPEGLDVLMTHTPPEGGAAGGDQLLGEALSRLKAPPKVHVFGHMHRDMGCGVALVPCVNSQAAHGAEGAAGAAGSRPGSRLWINAAQAGLLHHEPDGGGFAWVFDLPATQ